MKPWVSKRMDELKADIIDCYDANSARCRKCVYRKPCDAVWEAVRLHRTSAKTSNTKEQL